MQKIVLAAFVAILGLFSLSSIASAADRGTEKEAIAMVQKAVAYYKKNGRDKAIAEFNNPSGQFRDKDLYIFALVFKGGKKGTMLGHVNPKMVGQDVTDLRDPKDNFFIKKMLVLAEQKPSGWVDYSWVDPKEKATYLKKTSYQESIDDLIIGCGIYK